MDAETFKTRMTEIFDGLDEQVCAKAGQVVTHSLLLALVLSGCASSTIVRPDTPLADRIPA